MASWQGTLSDSEIADVAAYVRLLPTLASQKIVEISTDPFEGRRLYRSYCLVCHGVDGKSIGPLADKLDLEPADLSSGEYQTKKVKELAVIIAGYRRKEGSNMPRWGAVFPMTDLHNVAAYITRLTRNDLRTKGIHAVGGLSLKAPVWPATDNLERGKVFWRNLSIFP